MSLRRPQHELRGDVKSPSGVKSPAVGVALVIVGVAAASTFAVRADDPGLQHRRREADL